MNNPVAHVLEINHLRMRYPFSPCSILEDFNFKISYGDRIALVGPSGCGKSTVAKVILKLLPKGSFCEGEVLINGQDLSLLSKPQLRKIRGEDIGFIFQDPMSRLNPLMKIGEHLIDTLMAHRPGENYRFYRQKSEELLKKVGIDPSRFNSYPHEFSGGMRQRLIIALAIALNPLLIIADEPTTSLDIEVANQVMGELRDLCDQLGASLLLITHDLAMAARFCDRMAILDAGCLVEQGYSKDILTSPQSLVAQRLVSAARARESRKKSGRKITQKNILKVTNLRCWHSLNNFPFGKKWIKAVDDINFVLPEGESLGVVGGSGCGKSTLCRALMGLIPIRGGQINLLGKELNRYENKLEIRQAMQMVFQDPLACLNPKMKVGEAIADPLLIHRICSLNESKEKARHLLAQVGLNPPEEYENRFPKELSGGQQQRVAIARSIALNPKILICDESLSMLDSEIQAEVLSLLKNLQKSLKLSILLITHDLNVAIGFCDQIMVLDNGKIVEKASGDELLLNSNKTIIRKLLLASPRLPDL